VRGRVTGLGNVLRLEGVGEGFALDSRGEPAPTPITQA